MRQAIVIGASGLVGTALTKQLTALRNSIPVRVLVRKHLPDLPVSVEQIIVDELDIAEKLEPHIPKDSWVFCCVGTTMRKAGGSEAFRAIEIDIPVAIAQAAQASGVGGLSVVSSAGASISSFFFYTRTKGEMEMAVQSAGLGALQIFRPGLLLGKRKDRRLGEWIAVGISKLVTPLFRGPLAKYKPIRAEALAKVMIAKAEKGGLGMHVFEGEKLFLG